MAKFVMSDSHMRHKPIVEQWEPSRPFSTIEEHDRFIIAGMIEILRQGHILYHLGDVVMYDDLSVLQPLKPYRSQLKLALGNHDTPAKLPLLQEVFGTVAMCFELGDVMLSHFPIHESQLPRFGGNIHGHVHMSSLNDPRYYNVSMENIGYRPILLSSVKELMKNAKETYVRAA